MYVLVQIEGGFAPLPGLMKPHSLDSDALSSQEADELQQLVENAHFFALPAQPQQPAAGAADYRTYTLTISDGSRYNRVKVNDPIADSKLQELLDFVEQHFTA